MTKNTMDEKEKTNSFDLIQKQLVNKLAYMHPGQKVSVEFSYE